MVPSPSRFVFLLAAIGSCTGPALAGESGGAPQADESPKITVRDVVRANLEPSYLVYAQGITGLAPLYFETSIVPSFSILPRQWHVALFLTPKIVLRMFRENSAPVKTPSYMPRLTTFLWFEEDPDLFTVYYLMTLGHHSNGQSGSATNPDGTRNHETGNFQTNFVELGGRPS